MAKRCWRTLFLLIVTIGLIGAGCAQPSPKSTAAKTPAAAKPAATPKPVVTLKSKPPWLLIGGVDVKDSLGGDIITSNNLSGVMGYEIRGYGGDSITFTFVRGGNIIYWKGKGEITNLSAGERVLVPLGEAK